MKEISLENDIEQFANTLSCEISDIIDLSSSINFLKPNINIDFNSLDISTYQANNKLLDTISKHYNINKEQIEFFNNKQDAILKFFNYINKDYCSIYSPISLEYKNACITYNYKYDLINIFTQQDRAINENSLVIFSNPSIINGKYYDIELYLKAWYKLGCIVLIDETFLDFTNYNSVLKYVNKYDNLYILKSFDKYYSSYNITLNIIISNDINMNNFSKNNTKYNISAYDSIYLQACLNDTIFNNTAKAINIKNHTLLYNILNSSKYIKKIYPSNTNFFLVELIDITSIEFQNHLKKYKILIKDCSNLDFLNNYFVRISVKDECAIKVLKEALDELS